VEDVSDHDRVAVLLNLLGRKVRVFVGADLIAAA
jgi:transcriptional antiterminator RfaH